MKEFSCGAIGAIQNSTKPGHMVRIDDDSANSGGFLILEWWEGSTGPNVNGAFESPRFLRRLNTLRGLSHEEDEQVLARGA